MDKNSLYPILYRIDYPHATLYIVAIALYSWAIEDTRWMCQEQYPEYNFRSNTGTFTVGPDIILEEEYFESLECARKFIAEWWSNP